MDVGEGRGGCILNHIKEEKIGNAQVIQPVRDDGMLTNAIERVAENEQRSEVGVEERFDAHLIARAENAARPGIPNGKDEISNEMFHTLLAPGLVSAQNEFGVSGSRKAVVAVGLQGGHQVTPAIDAGVGNNPGLAIETERLAIVP
jgi:hypothetical protein